MFENNLWTMEPVGRPENTIQGDKYRFTLLTPCLIRMEYREDGKFEDRPTQVVWNRKFNPVDFRVEKKGEKNCRLPDAQTLPLICATIRILKR